MSNIDWSSIPTAAATPPTDTSDRFTWRPAQVGDNVRGRLVTLKQIETKKYGPRTVGELDDATGVSDGSEIPAGPVTFWPTPALAGMLRDRGVDLGAVLEITFTEEIDTGKSIPFKSFHVTVVDVGAEAEEPF